MVARERAWWGIKLAARSGASTALAAAACGAQCLLVISPREGDGKQLGGVRCLGTLLQGGHKTIHAREEGIICGGRQSF